MDRINKPLAFYCKENSESSACYDAYRSFPEDIQDDGGYQLHLIQQGQEPADFDPMKQIGAGVYELRLDDELNEYRVIYVAKFEDAIWVLHAFQKKTRKTRQADIDIAKAAFNDLTERRKKVKAQLKKHGAQKTKT